MELWIKKAGSGRKKTTLKENKARNSDSMVLLEWKR